jgi:hypothetical protein
MRVVCLLIAVLGGVASATQADMLASYHLGETDSLGNSNLPLDSVGGHDFLNAVGTPSVIDVTDGAPGSTKALSFSGEQGFYYVNSGFIPTDNYRVEVWAKTEKLTGQANLFYSSPADGGLVIGVLNGNWVAGHAMVDWIGADSGVGQPITAGKWTRLDVERVNGISTLYIDGIAQAGTSNATPVNDAHLHLGIQPGGTTFFAGALDELSICRVPEPTTGLMLIIGVASVLTFGWAKRRS